MELLIKPLGSLQANCYILYDHEGGEAVVIDPGFDGKKVMDILKEKKLNCKYVILTHGHGDHIGGVPELMHGIETELVIHEADLDMLHDREKSFTKAIGYPDVQTEASILVKDGDTLEVGHETLKVLHTPGHTKGGISILAGNRLFVGDTLFNGSIGRTDFPGGSFDEIKESIQRKLFILDEDTIVYPGHGSPTTIRKEKQTNPFVGLR